MKRSSFAEVEVFITNVQGRESADRVIHALTPLFPHCKFNFDLDDCDKILRAEGTLINTEEVIKCLNKYGFWGKILE